MASPRLRFLSALALCACQAPSPVVPEAKPLGPPVILSGQEAFRLLRPCTRPQPGAVDSIWTPDTASVRALEAGLAAYLIQARRSHPGRGPTDPLDTYRGQYTGFVRQGQRLIYASFVSASTAAADSLFDRRALRWCDGGGHFFGLEYNPATGVFDQLAQNDLGAVYSE